MRMGHSSARAALIYQHVTRDRDVVIAKALDGMIREILDREWRADRFVHPGERRRTPSAYGLTSTFTFWSR